MLGPTASYGRKPTEMGSGNENCSTSADNKAGVLELHYWSWATNTYLQPSTGISETLPELATPQASRLPLTVYGPSNQWHKRAGQPHPRQLKVFHVESHGTTRTIPPQQRQTCADVRARLNTQGPPCRQHIPASGKGSRWPTALCPITHVLTAHSLQRDADVSPWFLHIATLNCFSYW